MTARRPSSGDKELARFRSIAAGSTSELDYQLLLASDLGHLPSDAHAHLAEEVSEVRRMLLPFHSVAERRVRLTPDT
jgi:four helix bundle protein